MNVTHGQKVRDHDFLIAHIECAVPETITVKREVWNYARADWMRLQGELAEVDWSFIKSACPHEGAERMTELILDRAMRCIGRRTLQENKSTHPRLNERTGAATEARNRAAGTAQEHQAMLDCGEVMRAEREKYISTTKCRPLR